MCCILNGVFFLHGHVDCQSKDKHKGDDIFQHGTCLAVEPTTTPFRDTLLAVPRRNRNGTNREYLLMHGPSYLPFVSASALRFANVSSTSFIPSTAAV